MRRLADVLEAVSGTTSKLQKIDLLAAYLQSLSDDELQIACTYLTGAPFPAGDGRPLNVGWSAIADALLDVSGSSWADLDSSYLKHGDLGSVAAELLTRKVRAPLFPTPPTLTTVNQIFSRLAASAGKGSRQIKLEAMRSLFENADPLEAKYLVRIITSDMRVGLKEGLLEEAVAKAFGRSLDDVRRANMLISDIGAVAVLARHGRLGEARLQLFRPFRFMLADPIFTPAEAFEPVRGDSDGGGPPEALLVEDKYDGVRAQAHYDGTRLAIFSRTLDEITPSFPELPGKRGRQWMKLKEELATLDVVVIAAEQGHGKRAGVLSDVTFAVRNGETLAPIGKAYSGLTDAEIASLTEWFRAHTVVDRGRVKLVEPKIVLEGAFDAITRSPRHPSGYALRFPRIQRIRDDKTA